MYLPQKEEERNQPCQDLNLWFQGIPHLVIGLLSYPSVLVSSWKGLGSESLAEIY